MLESDSSDEEHSNDNYIYFLARKHGKYLIDPLSETPDFSLCQDDSLLNEDIDHDSEDSNRESAD